MAAPLGDYGAATVNPETPLNQRLNEASKLLASAQRVLNDIEMRVHGPRPREAIGKEGEPLTYEDRAAALARMAGDIDSRLQELAARI